MTAAIGKPNTLPGRLRRVLAPNPSAMTGPGTFTDIVGERVVAIIDPGPDIDSHLAAVLAALEPGEAVAAILVTHPHLDHSALAPRLAAATGAPVLAFGPAGHGRSALMQRLVAEGLQGGGEGVDRAFAPDRRLADGEVVAEASWSLRVLHTPGHMGGHLCFAWEDVLFSGDHVMGWAPSLVSPPEGDMGAYMTSLARLAEVPWRQMLPTHGAPIAAPAQRLKELTALRRKRETMILAALAAGPARLEALTAQVYGDLAPGLLPAAQRSALAHLIDLAQRNLVHADPAPSLSALWTHH